MVQMNGVLDNNYREYLQIYIFPLSDGSVFELLVKDEGKDVFFFLERMLKAVVFLKGVIGCAKQISTI